MAKYQDVCHMCNGKGRDGGCPRCGLHIHQVIAVQTIHLDIPADIIPIPYQGKLWVKPEGQEGLSLKFSEFDATLEKVKVRFLEGELPKYSMFISAPPKYGKHAFAYTCMQTALVQRYSVAPLLSTSDWRRIYKVSQMNPFYKLYSKYKWDDLVSCEVVFLFVDHSDDRFDVITLLKDILDVRASFGLPTFVISDYKLEELTPRWNTESYSMIHNPVVPRDFYRYPIITQRFD